MEKCMLYASLPTKYLAQDGTEKDGIVDILNVCRERNPQLGITGILLYGDHKFIQLLEGNAEAIDKLAQRIKNDNRHDYFVTLMDAPIEQRFFPTWAMGCKYFGNEVRKLDEFLLLTIEILKSSDTPHEQQTKILDLFLGLVKMAKVEI